MRFKMVEKLKKKGEKQASTGQLATSNEEQAMKPLDIKYPISYIYIFLYFVEWKLRTPSSNGRKMTVQEKN